MESTVIHHSAFIVSPPHLRPPNFVATKPQTRGHNGQNSLNSVRATHVFAHVLPTVFTFALDNRPSFVRANRVMRFLDKIHFHEAQLRLPTSTLRLPPLPPRPPLQDDLPIRLPHPHTPRSLR